MKILRLPILSHQGELAREGMNAENSFKVPQKHTVDRIKTVFTGRSSLITSFHLKPFKFKAFRKNIMNYLWYGYGVFYLVISFPIPTNRTKHD